MPSELIIMRHGKSDWDSGKNDFQRPLAKRGKRSAKRIGRWLQSQGLLPDYVISSPVKRAISTAKRTCKAAGMDAGRIVTDRRIYLADRKTLIKVLQDAPASAGRVLLVGHNPGLEDLLLYLAGSGLRYGDDGKLLPTAAIARLRLPPGFEPISFERGVAKLLSLTRARSLK